MIFRVVKIGYAAVITLSFDLKSDALPRYDKSANMWPHFEQ